MTARARLTARQCEARSRRDDVIKTLYSKINIAKSQLKMVEEDYRAMLVRITGNDSLKLCIETELEAVLNEMRRLGFKDSKPRAAQPTEKRKLDTSETSSKIRAIWLQMHRMGIVRSAAESSLNTYVKRLAGVDDLSWLRGQKTEMVTETLKKWAVREAPDKLRGLWIQLHTQGKRPALSEAALSAFIHHAMVERGGREPNTYDNLITCYEQLRAELEAPDAPHVSR
jgi:phage gp16-like protein